MSESSDLPYQDIYQWAGRLAAEQGEIGPEDYLWNSETRNVVRRLINTNGNMVAVLGLQGSGKTTFKKILGELLKEQDTDGNPLTLEVSFTGKDSIDKALKERTTKYEVYNETFLNTFLNLLHDHAGRTSLKFDKQTLTVYIYQLESRIHRIVKGEPEMVPLLARLALNQKITTEDKKILIEALPRIVKKLGKKFEKELITTIREEHIKEIKNYIIEFPDYDKTYKGQMNRDLIEFQKWWKQLYTSESETLFWQDANIVIFWQKEIWRGNFLFGKWKTIELKPFDPQQLMEYYKQQFGTTEPFEEDALIMIAGLARGIFRWYKKYISDCLEKYYDQPEKTSITTQDIKNWITLDQLVEDWEKELADAFTKRGQIRKAIKILTYLKEHEETQQTEIQLEFFGEGDTEKTACSRMLNKLEDIGQIASRKDGKNKLVRKV